MLHITGTRDWDVFYGAWVRKRRTPFNSINRHDQVLVVVRGANHSTFADEESLANRAAHDAVRVSTIVFWDAYLREDARALHILRESQFADAMHSAARVTVKP